MLDFLSSSPSSPSNGVGRGLGILPALLSCHRRTASVSGKMHTDPITKIMKTLPTTRVSHGPWPTRKPPRGLATSSATRKTE